VQVVQAFPGHDGVLLGRTAARSALFGANPAAGGDSVLIGSAAGPTPGSVRPRALGELRERMGNVLAGRRAEAGADHPDAASLTGSFDALRRRGVPALDPAALSPTGDLSTRAAPMLWVFGESSAREAPVAVPAGTAYLRHRPPVGCAAPVRAGSTGLAAHRDREQAVRHAAWEVLERHLLWQAWFGTATSVAPPSPPAPTTTVLDGLGLAVRLWAIAGPGRSVAVLAAVHTGGGHRASFGARAAASDRDRVPAHAVEVAVYEALMVRWSMGTPAAARSRAALHAAGGVPADPVQHAVHAYDGGPAAIGHLDARLGPRGAAEGDPGHPPAHPAPPDPVALLAEATGRDVVVVDTGAPEAGDQRVVRVIAPGARRLPSAPSDAPAGAPPHPFG
jgi:ribosomal protein S12 methylthiotransferase accessory factor